VFVCVCARARVHVFAHVCTVSEDGVRWCVVYQHTERLRKSERTHARTRAREKTSDLAVSICVYVCVCVCKMIYLCTRHIHVRKKCSTYM